MNSQTVTQCWLSILTGRNEWAGSTWRIDEPFLKQSDETENKMETEMRGARSLLKQEEKGGVVLISVCVALCTCSIHLWRSAFMIIDHERKQSVLCKQRNNPHPPHPVTLLRLPSRYQWRTRDLGGTGQNDCRKNVSWKWKGLPGGDVRRRFVCFSNGSRRRVVC